MQSKYSWESHESLISRHCANFHRGLAQQHSHRFPSKPVLFRIEEEVAYQQLQSILPVSQLNISVTITQWELKKPGRILLRSRWLSTLKNKQFLVIKSQKAGSMTEACKTSLKKYLEKGRMLCPRSGLWFRTNSSPDQNRASGKINHTYPQLECRLC